MIKKLVWFIYIVFYNGSMNVFLPIYKEIKFCLGIGVFIMRCDNLTVCVCVCVLYVFV